MSLAPTFGGPAPSKNYYKTLSTAPSPCLFVRRFSSAGRRSSHPLPCCSPVGGAILARFLPARNVPRASIDPAHASSRAGVPGRRSPSIAGRGKTNSAPDQVDCASTDAAAAARLTAPLLASPRRAPPRHRHTGRPRVWSRRWLCSAGVACFWQCAGAAPAVVSVPRAGRLAVAGGAVTGQCPRCDH